MTVIENRCCNCAVPGYPCRGASCPNLHVPVHYCDNEDCGRELTEDEICDSGLEFCTDCLEKMKGDINVSA